MDSKFGVYLPSSKNVSCYAYRKWELLVVRYSSRWMYIILPIGTYVIGVGILTISSWSKDKLVDMINLSKKLFSDACKSDKVWLRELFHITKNSSRPNIWIILTPLAHQNCSRSCSLCSFHGMNQVYCREVTHRTLPSICHFLQLGQYHKSGAD